MNLAAVQMARRLVEPLASRDRWAFDPEHAVSRLLASSDRLLAAAASDEAGAQSIAQALAWTQRSVPDVYPAAIAAVGDPAYDPAWDSGRFPGFGYGLMSSYLYLDYQLENEALYQLVMVRLERPAILSRLVSSGQALVEDEFSGALAHETSRERRNNLSFADQLQAGFASLDSVREELEARALCWEQQIEGWTTLRGPAEPWRDLVITTTTHLSSVLGTIACKLTPRRLTRRIRRPRAQVL